MVLCDKQSYNTLELSYNIIISICIIAMEIIDMLLIIYYLNLISYNNEYFNLQALRSNKIPLYNKNDTNHIANNYILSKVSSIIIIGDASKNERVSIPIKKHNSIFSTAEFSFNAYETPKVSIV